MLSVITGARLISLTDDTGKCCNTCDDSLILGVNWTESGKSQRNYKCTTCANKERRLRAALNRISYKKYVETRGDACEACHVSYDIVVYHFHHPDPVVKERSVEAQAFVWGGKIHLEAEKCHLLCANCHALEHKALREGHTLLTNSSTNET